ncbi:hypothetical protein N7519_009792 [Penicillium mononematosum]|uniref:uncharacterized protein n=1 Tax=Penicillium mononematosum TaxID=268346 RepID=UPI0025469149|nr:uncharacterized protein N7519_009792 [Penicillium mononematosum]KAJ6179331.1 hypothetical protein N7519_009792 [Penicillium mononematosum]
MGWSMGESPVSLSGLSGKVGGGVLEPLLAIVAACTEPATIFALRVQHVVIPKEWVVNNEDPAVHGVWSGSQVQA